MHHVQNVFLVPELAVTGVDQRRVRRLLTAIGKDLSVLDHDLVPVDENIVDGKRPVLDSRHRVEKELADCIDSLDPPPSRIDEDGVVGEKGREIDPRTIAGIDLGPKRQIALERRSQFFRSVLHDGPPSP